MRLKEIDLKSYANFQNKVIDLKRSDTDFHLIFGLNEAGKSTTKQSISDTLYGPKNGPNTTAAYRVGSSRVRVGATLEHEGKELSIVRKTGNRNTLLDAQERPFPEGEDVLHPFLNGINQEHFNRGFSVDYESLIEGGREMLNLNSEVGKIIFAASVFIVGLKDKLQTLADSSSAIWRSSARAQNYPLNMVYGDIDQHKRDKVTHELDVQRWSELSEEIERNASERKELESRRHGIADKLASLRLVDKVLPLVRKYLAAKHRLDLLGSVPELKADAETEVSSADRTILELTPQIKAETKNAQNLASRLGELEIDDVLLENAEWIQSLYKKQGEIEKAQLDSKNREKEAGDFAAVILSKAQSIRWDNLTLEEIESRLPTHDVIQQLTLHQLEESGLKTQFKTDEQHLKRARDRVKELTYECEGLRDSQLQTTRLTTLLTRSQSWRELEVELRNFERRLEAKNREVQQAFLQLKPYVASENDLRQTQVPSKSTLSKYEDKLLALNEAQKEAERELASCQESIHSLSAEIAKVQSQEEPVTQAKLRESRATRDELWLSIQHDLNLTSRDSSSFVVEDSVQQQLQKYHQLVAESDALADALLLQVNLEYEHTRLLGERAMQSTIRERLDRDLKVLREEISSVELEWQNVWKGFHQEVSSPQDMQNWLEDRELAQRLLLDRDHLVEDVRDRTEQYDAIVQDIETELDTIGIAPEDPIENLSDRIEFADRIVKSQDKLDVQIGSKEKELVTAKQDLKSSTERFESDQLKLQEWGEKWETGLSNAGLAVQTGVATANNISVLRSIVNDFVKLRDAKHRIDAMRDDVQLFDRDIRKLAEVLQREQSTHNNDQFLSELIGEFERMRLKQKQRMEIENELEACESSLAALQHRREIAKALLSDIQDSCGVKSRQELTEILQKSNEQKLELERIREYEEELLSIGSGYSLEELIRQSAQADPAEIRQQINELQQEENQSVHAIERNAAQASENEHSKNELVQTQAAYLDDAVLESRFAEAERLAARYVRIKAQEIALDWIVERFRQENQAPIMLIAARIFETITRGKYCELTTTENNRGVPQLLCVRMNAEGDREEVKLENLSSGTRDQLFLALRFAAIEHFIDQGQVMPLIADDLLINSDDERAKVIFGLFKDLSKKTQILFFTHHEHLIPIAKQVFGDDLSVQRLSSNG